MGKLRDYSFIVNLRPNVLFFAEAGERKQMESLSRSSKKKKKKARSQSSSPYCTPLSSLAIWGWGMESLFKDYRSWKQVPGRKNHRKTKLSSQSLYDKFYRFTSLKFVCIELHPGGKKVSDWVTRDAHVRL